MKEVYAIIKYKNSKNKDINYFSIFNTEIKVDLLFERNLINYDVELKQLLSKSNIILFFNKNQKMSLGLFSNHKSLKNYFLNIKNKGCINIFYKLEKKKNFFFLKKKKLYFLSDIGLNKILCSNAYTNSFLRELCLRFLRKQNQIFLFDSRYKNKNIFLFCILLEIQKINPNVQGSLNIKNFVFYVPLLHKIFLIKKKNMLDLKIFREILKMFLKKSKKRLKFKKTKTFIIYIYLLYLEENFFFILKKNFCTDFFFGK